MLKTFLTQREVWRRYLTPYETNLICLCLLPCTTLDKGIKLDSVIRRYILLHARRVIARVGETNA